MVQFPVPPSGVEPVIEQPREAGIREDAYTIVLPTETVISAALGTDRTLPRPPYLTGGVVRTGRGTAPANSTFFAFLILSTIIATTGFAAGLGGDDHRRDGGRSP